jgi:ABC-type sugar transport system ATPase subunit
LRLEGLAKRYADIEALAPLDLEVAAGELLVVVGPSGCGKTTLLRLIAGLEAPSEGRVVLGQDEVTSWRPGRRNVAMVFQSYALFPHLTIAQNIGFGLVVRDVPAREVTARVRDAAALVGCDELLGRRPAELSGGERQRVALARALVREPALLLLDEPLSNLDTSLRAAVRAELRDIHRRVGTTTVHVTHDQVEALMLGDRIAVLRDGVVQQVGPPEEVWAMPANRFVATFVGAPAMNMVSAQGKLAPAEVPTVAREIGVRPEHVSVGSDGAAASVVLVEPVGSEAYVHLRVADETLVARVPAEARPRQGTVVRVSLDPARLHFFDAAGRRVTRP